jgi:hypothetical protein
MLSVRAESSHRSEQVTQLLFGETYTVKEQFQDWIRICISDDDYEGWIPVSGHQEIGLTDHTELTKQKPFLCYDLVQVLVNHQSVVSILLGSNLPWYRSGHLRIGSVSYTFEGNVRQPDNQVSSRNIVENAYMYLNAPYMWGGRGPFGIDCSGLTQMTFKLCGINLRRDAWMQAEGGQTIHLLDESQAGDLAFFDNEEGRITHVGILTSKNRIIHASGKVRIDSIDHHGIFNQELRRYTHNLRLIKRII